MLENYKWEPNGTSLILKDFPTEEEAIQFCSELHLFNESNTFKSQYEDGKLELYDADLKNLFFLEEDFIKNVSMFNTLLEKFSTKNYEGTINYYSKKNGFIKNTSSSILLKENELFKLLVENNILINDGLKQEQLYISPSMFELIKCFVNEHEEEAYYNQYKNILTYMRELFSLISLAEKTTYKNSNGKQIFHFQNFHTVNGVMTKEVEWKNWDSLVNENYYSLYKWIVEIGEYDKSYNYKSFQRELNLRKSIVQNYLKNKNNFKTTKDSIKELDSILLRIRNNQTETYFEQKHKLKNEMVQLMHEEMESKKNVFKRLLGLLTTVSVGYYSQFYRDTGITELGDLAGPNFELALLFVFSMIAIIFFMLTLFREIKEKIDYYWRIKDIYINDLFFDEDDFRAKMPKPKIWKDYRFYWLILFISLFIFKILFLYYLFGFN